MKAYRDENGLPRVGTIQPHKDNRHWENLTKDERREYIMYQMAPSHFGSYSPYLPDGCHECPICSTPVSGSGLCQGCSARFDALDNKLRRRTNE